MAFVRGNSKSLRVAVLFMLCLLNDPKREKSAPYHHCCNIPVCVFGRMYGDQFFTDAF